MKVVCIKKDAWVWASGGRNYTPKDPVFGEECTVTLQMEYDGLLLYKLVGYTEWYNSKQFAPLSSIDETEFEREYNKQTVCP